jgi:hypothetical protein
MKYEDVHTRAKALLAASLLEPLGENDGDWLAAHLSECESCTAVHSAQRTMIGVLKTIPANTPTFLASRTKALVRSRIHEMEENSQRVQLLVISCLLALGTTIIMVPAAWKLFSWAGGLEPLSKTLMWGLGLLWFWGVPALAGAALLLTHRNGQPRAFRSAMTRRLSL